MAETLTEIDALLAVAGIEPGADAQLLLGHVLGEVVRDPDLMGRLVSRYFHCG